MASKKSIDKEMKTQRLDLRVSHHDIDLLDRLRAHLQKHMNLTLSRSEVIRHCVLRVFEQESRDKPIAPITKRRAASEAKDG